MRAAEPIGWAGRDLDLGLFELDGERLTIAGGVLLLIGLAVLVGRRLGRWAGNRRRETRSVWRHGSVDSPGIVVITHGSRNTARSLEPLADAIVASARYKDYGVFLYDYSAGILSNESPENLATVLGGELREMLLETLSEQPAKDLILIGHSVGGLLMRKTYLDEVRRHRNDSRHPEYASSWAARVSRIVLIAAPNRGSSMVANSTWFRWLQYYPARIWRVGGLVRSIIRGAPFIVNLRLEWIQGIRELFRVPAVAQFVGGDDREVAPEDSRDVLSMPNARMGILPGSGHQSILSHRACHFRIQRFLEDSEARDQSPAAGESLADPAETAVKVLVMHGIRDHGDRFSKQIKPALERAIRETGRKPIVRAPRYRYFSALDFLLPWTRELRVQRFADEYADLLAHAPHTIPVHFVGHSFGTYQLGAALEAYDEVRVGRVYLAGCVLHEDFPWTEYLQPDDMVTESAKPKVLAVCNTLATRDLPVGLLCDGVRFLKLSRLIGTGGYNGFTGGTSSRLVKLSYYTGGHGAALDGVENLATITDWILDRGGAPDGSGDARRPFDSEAAEERLRQTGRFTPGERPAVLPTVFRFLAPALALAAVGALTLPWLTVGGDPTIALGTALALGVVLRYV